MGIPILALAWCLLILFVIAIVFDIMYGDVGRHR
jgi:hypothetical protein